MLLGHPSDSSYPMRAVDLDTLNPDQRRAVEHGGSAIAAKAPPLLIIAGAGSGKTNTLAHRVAHLIATGVDPKRIMLLTFSRRGAISRIMTILLFDRDIYLCIQM
jgi:superfamily I DNA/RNA helicase